MHAKSHRWTQDLEARIRRHEGLVLAAINCYRQVTSARVGVLACPDPRLVRHLLGQLAHLAEILALRLRSERFGPCLPTCKIASNSPFVIADALAPLARHLHI